MEGGQSYGNPPPLLSPDFPPLLPPQLPSISSTSLSQKPPSTVNAPPHTTQSSSQNTSLNPSPPLWKDLFSRSSSSPACFPPPSFTTDGVPVVKAPPSVLLKTSELWKDFIICQFFGEPPPLKKIFSDLNPIWCKKGSIQVRHYTPNSCLILIPNLSTRNWVLDNGLWSTGTVAFAVSSWTPSSTLSEQILTSAPVWLTLQGVPPQLWSNDGFSIVASGVGIPLPPSNSETISPISSGSPKIQAIVPLDKGPLPTTVIVEDKEGEQVAIGIQYSTLPPLCPTCKKYGHRSHRCPIRSRIPPETIPSPANRAPAAANTGSTPAAGNQTILGETESLGFVDFGPPTFTKPINQPVKQLPMLGVGSLQHLMSITKVHDGGPPSSSDRDGPNSIELGPITIPSGPNGDPLPSSSPAIQTRPTLPVPSQISANHIPTLPLPSNLTTAQLNPTPVESNQPPSITNHASPSSTPSLNPSSSSAPMISSEAPPSSMLPPFLAETPERSILNSLTVTTGSTLTPSSTNKPISPLRLPFSPSPPATFTSLLLRQIKYGHPTSPRGPRPSIQPKPHPNSTKGLVTLPNSNFNDFSDIEGDKVSSEDMEEGELSNNSVSDQYDLSDSSSVEYSTAKLSKQTKKLKKKGKNKKQTSNTRLYQ